MYNVELILDALVEAHSIPQGAVRAGMIASLHKELEEALGFLATGCECKTDGVHMDATFHLFSSLT